MYEWWRFWLKALIFYMPEAQGPGSSPRLLKNYINHALLFYYNYNFHTNLNCILKLISCFLAFQQISIIILWLISIWWMTEKFAFKSSRSFICPRFRRFRQFGLNHTQWLNPKNIKIGWRSASHIPVF